MSDQRSWDPEGRENHLFNEDRLHEQVRHKDDEIERLRERLREQKSDLLMRVHTLEDERDGLRARMAEYEHLVMTGRNEQHDALVTERDSLRVKLMKMAVLMDVVESNSVEWMKKCLKAEAERDALRAESKQLRVAAHHLVQAYEDGDDMQSAIDLMTSVLDAAIDAAREPK